MKLFNLKGAAANAPISATAKKDMRALGLLAGITCVMLVSIGALNGGAAPTASVWDGVSTYLTGLLSSTFVLVLASIALVGCVWQVAHGRGYSGVGLILGILALALIGPGIVVSAATATRDPQAAGAMHAVHTAPTHAAPVLVAAK